LIKNYFKYTFQSKLDYSTALAYRTGKKLKRGEKLIDIDINFYPG